MTQEITSELENIDEQIKELEEDKRITQNLIEKKKLLKNLQFEKSNPKTSFIRSKISSGFDKFKTNLKKNLRDLNSGKKKLRLYEGQDGF